MINILYHLVLRTFPRPVATAHGLRVTSLAVSIICTSIFLSFTFPA